MLFGFVRVGAVVKMRVRDFEDAGGDAFLVLHEKGGKERRIPCHHLARKYLREYLSAAGIDSRSKLPLFQSAPGRSALLCKVSGAEPAPLPSSAPSSPASPAATGSDKKGSGCSFVGEGSGTTSAALLGLAALFLARRRDRR